MSRKNQRHNRNIIDIETEREMREQKTPFESKIIESKGDYDTIITPLALIDVVEGAISSKKEENHMKKNSRKFPVIGGAVAVILICFIIGLNTSEAFANSAGDIPVFGMIAKVLTVRSYTEVQDNITTKVEVPEIKTEQTDDKDAANEKDKAITDINAEIERLVEEYVSDAKLRMEEYKLAFLETGGTEAEWEEREIDIDVSYEVKSQSDDNLSLMIVGNESWVSAYGVQYFYNIDLRTGNMLTLEDILGENYVQIANDAVLKGMERNVEEDPDYVYWGHAGDSSGEDEMSIEGFVTVNADTKFYMNEAGNPVVVFDKYEIAPGFMGIQEFEIL